MEQEQLQLLFNSLPIGVGIYTKDQTLIYFNERFQHVFGLPGSYFYANLPEEIKDGIRKGTRLQTSFFYHWGENQAERRAAGNLSGCHIKCTGQPICNAEGESTQYALMVEDITETVHNQEQLNQSRKKTELAMQAADIMLWEFDVQSQLFYSENEPMNGYDNSKPLSIESYLNTLHLDDQASTVEIMRRMCNGEDFTFTFNARINFPGNPEMQYCTISGSPFGIHKNGKFTKFVGTRKNNTEIYKKQQLLNKILDHIPLSIHIKDVEDNFRYTFCNEESKRMFGTSIDKTTYDVLSEAEVQRIQKTDIEVFKTGEPYLGLERIVTKDGQSHDTIVRKSVIEDDGKRLLMSTRWEQGIQNELKRRSQLFSIVLKAIDAYTWFFEPDKNRLSFDDGFDKGSRKASNLNTVEKFVDHIHPEDRERFVASLQTVLAKDAGMWDVEVRVDFEENGTYQWWEIRGVLESYILNDAPYKYMFGMSINIDAHKQNELTLLKHKEKLNKLVKQNELVLNNTNSGLAYITKDYIVQWENISLCSKSLSYEAYKKGEFCYKSAHNRTSPCNNCVLQRTLKSRQTEQIKFTLDSDHSMEIFATPVFLDDGTIDGIVIRVDDVTEREQMIKELRNAKKQAEQSDKLKSAFLANMSHEIRTPLNAIVGFSELMIYAEESEKEDYIQIINSNNELLLKLINDILDLSKLEAGSVDLKYEKFNLSEHFNNMAASMKQRVTNPNVRLIDINPYDDCEVMLDRNRVAQILTNFVTNAIKYTPEGLIEMGYEKRGKGIYFYVKDTGIGIPEEKKSKVFHRFEKLDEFAQGTGLGLSICKAIAESMGGKIGFETKFGEGSLFWTFLPNKGDEATADVAEEELLTPETENMEDPEKTTDRPGKRKTILIAEDINSNYQLVSAILQKDYELIRAVNGKEALELVCSRPVDLLLMDMKMPIMDGLTTTEEIRRFNTKLPIVALTAHAFENDRLAALAAGCNGYLVKPINKARLMAMLKKYC